MEIEGQGKGKKWDGGVRQENGGTRREGDGETGRGDEKK